MIMAPFGRGAGKAGKPGLVLGMSLMLMLGLSACGGHSQNLSKDLNMRANEAPPAAPFGFPVQNLTEDNNYGKYREIRGEQHVEAASEAPRLELSQQMADSLVTMEGIRSAHVLVSGAQAFVAVTLQEPPSGSGADVPEPVKARITDRIKSLDASVDQVYVSGQSDLVHRFESVEPELRNGRPRDGLLRELSEYVGRTIPDWSIGNLTPRSVRP